MKIYIASKAIHRPRWRSLRSAGVPIISRWIDVEDKYSADPTGLDFANLWDMCVEDVRECDVLVCYVEQGEVLKGALVELGGALLLGKRIIASGPRTAYADNGTWLHHSGIEYSGKEISKLLVDLTPAELLDE